ncbi:hypothetical protein GIB67_042280, partial [Kingdonia uniflora]
MTVPSSTLATAPIPPQPSVQDPSMLMSKQRSAKRENLQWKSLLMCKQSPMHVTTEGSVLVKQAEDAASNKKVDYYLLFTLTQKCRKEICGWSAGTDVCEKNNRASRQIHDICERLLIKPLSIPQVLCNKGVAGSSSEELLASFCDNIPKKGGSEKLSDEAIEETLDKEVGPSIAISFSVYETLRSSWQIRRSQDSTILVNKVHLAVNFVSEKASQASYFAYEKTGEAVNMEKVQNKRQTMHTPLPRTPWV